MTNYNTNLASEFYVLSMLHRFGCNASLTLGNKKSVDIVVVRESGDVEVQPQVVAKPPETKKYYKTKTSTAKAKASKTNRGSVERMDRLDRERPDLASKVRTGEMKSTEALRQMSRDKNKEKIEKITKNGKSFSYPACAKTAQSSRTHGT